MSRVDDFIGVLNGHHMRLSPDVLTLLREIGNAWQQAEAAPISENEAQRWSRVCSAAERVVRL